MEFRIGQMSALLGIPVETLRFYEQKGLIHPSKQPGNGYRSYSTDDYFRLLVIKSFRGFGFGLNELVDMMAETGAERRAETMRRNAARLDAIIEEYRRVRDTSLSYAEALERVADSCGVCRIETSPALYRFNIFEGYHNQSRDHRTEQLTSRWVEEAPVYHMSFELTERAMRDYEHSVEYRWGLSFYEADAQRLGLTDAPDVTYFPARKSVFTVFACDREDGIELRTLSYVFDYIRDHGLQVSGNALGSMLYQPFSKEDFIRYHSLWVPVE